MVVLDIALPKLDGLAVLRTARARKVQTPVLLLTARDGISDKVAGLDLGADDYLAKPFAFDEFLARVRALLRRGQGQRAPVLRVAELSLDPATRAVTTARVAVCRLSSATRRTGARWPWPRRRRARTRARNSSNATGFAR